MKFKVSSPAMRARILRRGMWNIGNIPLVVTKWTPDELREKPEIKSIPMWVYLKNVPMNMFSWQGLSFITSAAGFPVRLHPETAACSNFKLAKVFVNVDLSKELPDKINFTKNGKSSLVEFIYPWLPLRCRSCGKWGHVDKACGMNKKDEAVKEKEIDVEETNEKGEKNEKSGRKKGVMEDKEEGEIDEGWLDATPGKASKNLKYGEVVIMSPSRFSPLMEVDEQGEKENEIKEIEESVEKEEMEEIVEIEEILSIEEEIIEEVNNKKDEEQEGFKKGADESTNEGNAEKRSVVGIQNQGIAGIQNTQENWPDLASASKLRPSLPRRSKTLHRVISENTNLSK